MKAVDDKRTFEAWSTSATLPDRTTATTQYLEYMDALCCFFENLVDSFALTLVGDKRTYAFQSRDSADVCGGREYKAFASLHWNEKQGQRFVGTLKSFAPY